MPKSLQLAAAAWLANGSWPELRAPGRFFDLSVDVADAPNASTLTYFGVADAWH
jgi:hypothetical protein